MSRSHAGSVFADRGSKTMFLAWFSLITALLSIVFTLFLAKKIQKMPAGSKKIKEVSGAIRTGAKAFLKRELRAMILIFFFVALALGILTRGVTAPLIFLFGAFTSSLVGYAGMMASTLANGRTANRARHNFPESFKIAISGGQVMGFLVVGFGLLGIIIIWLIFRDLSLLINYAFGASLVALFMRVGGGIFTKSADVGADLVGKIEAGIPEDDPRNPAVIADNVGDNVGDIAGMGSDLFESYVSTIIAAMVIGMVVHGTLGLIVPLVLAAIGILSSLLGSFLMKIPKNLEAKKFNEQTGAIIRGMNRGILGANLLMIFGSFLIFYFFEIKLFLPFFFGLITGFLIGKTTEYYTTEKRKPTLEIAQAAKIGPSGVVIEGLIVGMKSTVLPVLAVGITIVLSYYFGGLYGVALASVGILGVLGINLSADCYGPIVDNAAGIAEMAHLEPRVRQRTEALDAVGNTTAAIGKGFAISSAALAALAWLITFSQKAEISIINLLEPSILAGLLIGAMLPFLFSALAMKGVSQGAWVVVEEVRRQFREKKGIMAGTEKPDYGAVVDLATKKSLKVMLYPGILAIIAPVLLGLLIGKTAVAGLIIGALSSGFLLALFMANSGAAWDNAKKYIEAGNLGGKGSFAHKAAVIGDTLGDPFKDTAGPSLNILIKLISIVSLLALPLFL